MEGWVNVDHHAPADMDVDLLRFPWPWADSEIDAVAMFHVLEHFDPDGVVAALREVHRILKPGGTFWIRVPHARGISACGLGHKTFFTSSTIRAFSSGDFWFILPGERMFTPSYFRMKLLCFRDRWEWTPFDWFASKFPIFYEKLGLFPPAEIEWKGLAMKGSHDKE